MRYNLRYPDVVRTETTNGIIRRLEKGEKCYAIASNREKRKYQNIIEIYILTYIKRFE